MSPKKRKQTCELHIFHFPIVDPKQSFPSFLGLQNIGMSYKFKVKYSISKERLKLGSIEALIEGIAFEVKNNQWK